MLAKLWNSTDDDNHILEAEDHRHYSDYQHYGGADLHLAKMRYKAEEEAKNRPKVPEKEQDRTKCLLEFLGKIHPKLQ